MIDAIRPRSKKGRASDQKAPLIGQKSCRCKATRPRRPIRFFMSAGQASDDTAADALLASLPKVDRLLAERGHGKSPISAFRFLHGDTGHRQGGLSGQGRSDEAAIVAEDGAGNTGRGFQCFT